ncbi:MAG: hypothetical protein ACPG3T_00985, partial [Pseudomonadales bacterium]
LLALPHKPGQCAPSRLNEGWLGNCSPAERVGRVARIGRTGRAGETGTSISLACEDDAFMLLDIEALLGEKLACEQPPLEYMDES